MFKEFRPISLCNVAYKIISKILVLRLQDCMKEIISPNQNAFVKGRLISDSIFLTAEMMNFIHNARRKKTFWCEVKVDFFKAYDRVNWDFLETVLSIMKVPPSYSTNYYAMCSNCAIHIVAKWSESMHVLAAKRAKIGGSPLTLFVFVLYEYTIYSYPSS